MKLRTPRTVLTLLIMTMLLVLTACSGGGGGSSAPPNQPPSVVLGGDQNIGENDSITLSASGSSDSDGSIASITWAQVSGTAVTLTGADTLTPSLTAPAVDVETTLEFEVTLTDDKGAKSTGKLSITVIPNVPPSVTLGNAQSVIEADMVSLNAVSSDSDGTIQTITWVQTSGTTVLITRADSLTPGFEAPVTDTDLELVFDVTVTDDDGDTTTESVSVTVKPNVPPVASAGPDATYVEQNEIWLDGSGSSDSDGSIDIYEWTQLSGPAVTLLNADAVTASFTAPDITLETPLELNLKVTDNKGDFHEDAVLVNLVPHVAPTLNNHYPCDGCRYFGPSLSVTGFVEMGGYPPEVVAPTTLPVVTVSIEGIQVQASVAEDGSWVAENISYDSALTTVPVDVNATGPYGGQSSYSLTLANRPTLTYAMIAPDSLDTDIIYFYDYGVYINRFFKYQISSNSFEMLRRERLWNEVHVTFNPNFLNPWDVQLDQNNNQLLMVDGNKTALYGITLDGSQFTQLSSDTVGTGNSFSSPRQLELDSANNSAIVWNDGSSSLNAVDLATGDRSVIADNSGDHGMGNALTTIYSLAVNLATDTAYNMDSFGVTEVDLTTGTRSVPVLTGAVPYFPRTAFYDAGRDSIVNWQFVQDQLIGIDATTYLGSVISAPGTSGIAAPYISQVVHKTLTDQYLVNGFAANTNGGDTDSLLVIDPDTGDRSILMEDSLGTGPGVEFGTNIAFDAASQSIYSLEANTVSLIKLDLSTNKRSLISGDGAGSGDAFGNVFDLALDLANDIVYVVSRTQVFAVDTLTGDRTVISDDVTGTGPFLTTIEGMVYNNASGLILVIDSVEDALISVDPATGDRTIVSSALHAGDTFFAPRGVDLDEANNQALVIDEGTGATSTIKLLMVDLDTGIRTLISSQAVGNGPWIWDGIDTYFIQGTNQALVLDFGKLIRVDLTTGDRTLIAHYNTDEGEILDNVLRIAVDPAKQVAYGWGLRNEALFQIDLNTGHRVIVSK